MPESQPNLKREGPTGSSSWLANCLKRFPGRKVSSETGLDEGAIWNEKKKWDEWVGKNSQVHEYYS